MSAAAAARGRNVRSLSPSSSPRAAVATNDFRVPPARDRYSYSEFRSPRLGAIQEGAVRSTLPPPPPPPPPRPSEVRGRRRDCRSPTLDAGEQTAVRSLSPQRRGRRIAYRSPPADGRENGAARSLSPQPRDRRGDRRPPTPGAKGEGTTRSRYLLPSRGNAAAAVAAGAEKRDTARNPPAIEMKAVNGYVRKKTLAASGSAHVWGGVILSRAPVAL